MNAITSTASAEGDQALLIHFGRDAGEHGALRAQVIEIVASQANLHACLGAAGLKGSASGKNGDQVTPKSAEGDHQSVLKASAIGQQQHDRGNAPCHAQHGKQERRRLCFSALKACCQIAKHSYSSYRVIPAAVLPPGKQRGFARGIKAGDNARHRQRKNGDNGGSRHDPRRIESFRGRQLRQQRYERAADRQANAAAERSEERAFDKKLRHDVAMRGAQRLA